MRKQNKTTTAPTITTTTTTTTTKCLTTTKMYTTTYYVRCVGFHLHWAEFKSLLSCALAVPGFDLEFNKEDTVLTFIYQFISCLLIHKKKSARYRISPITRQSMYKKKMRNSTCIVHLIHIINNMTTKQIMFSHMVREQWSRTVVLPNSGYQRVLLPYNQAGGEYKYHSHSIPSPEFSGSHHNLFEMRKTRCV